MSNFNQFTRSSKSDIIDIYSGFDELKRPALLVKFKNRPRIEVRTQVLETNINKRQDNMWALLISLNNIKFSGVFEQLRRDLINSILGVTNQITAERILTRRYNEWQGLFEEALNQEIDFKKIQGIIGELYFIKNELIPRYGVDKTISSWIGPNGANKDFQLEKIWFEVKTKSVNKDEVHVSNVNQLISNQTGYLTVINCEQTSSEVINAMSINSLYESICSQINEESLLMDFNYKLAKLKFIPTDEYDKIYYLIQDIIFYKVGEDFPITQMSNLDISICNLKYDLFLPALKEYIEEDIEWRY